MPRHLTVSLASLALLACSAPVASTDDAPVGVTREPIVGGTPATAYPEAVVVTSSGFIPCSGVLLAPRVVLTAGHCKSTAKEYSVLAPNAGGQTVSGSNDWTTFGGQAATSSDTLLIFLDAPITLDAYPTIQEATVAAGTQVVDVGRTLNGTITMQDYVSPVVTIAGPGTPLGFPYNYEADPDISQDGDSGGPIELSGVTPHVVVAIVDTDTIEQGIDASTPIDLFARLDVVRSQILAQIAMQPEGAPDASTRDASEDARVTDAAPDAAHPKREHDASAHDAAGGDAAEAAHSDSGASEPPSNGGSSCSLSRGRTRSTGALPIAMLTSLAFIVRARRRRTRR